MDFCINDGGRAEAGYKGAARDCVCRAIAIATGQPYRTVYEFITAQQKSRGHSSKSGRANTARTGVARSLVYKIMDHYGFSWVPCMGIGTGCKVHLVKSELPAGIIIANLSRHVCAIIDGVIHDTHDPSRNGTRCVYGYWIKK